MTAESPYIKLLGIRTFPVAWMRGYIFTDNERRRLRKWLETREEDTTTRSIFVNIRRNLNRITDDVGLLTDIAKMLRAHAAS